jgi:hypothetical protein
MTGFSLLEQITRKNEDSSSLRQAGNSDSTLTGGRAVVEAGAATLSPDVNRRVVQG